jgi:hypothetical protein
MANRDASACSNDRSNNMCCCNLMLDLLREDVSDDKYRNIVGLAEDITDISSMDRAFYPDGSGASASERGRRRAVKGSTFCGALAAATAALYCVLGDVEAAMCHDETITWFGVCYGGYDCESVSSLPGFCRDDYCPRLILATYLHLRGYISPASHIAQKSVLY